MNDGKSGYQNLRVYEDMIQAISLGEEIASRWDSGHAIADHFSRASEGALVCLAEIANCSTTKLAARLEICAIRGRIDRDVADDRVRVGPTIRGPRHAFVGFPLRNPNRYRSRNRRPQGKIPDPKPVCTGVDPYLDFDPDFDGIAPWAIR